MTTSTPSPSGSTAKESPRFDVASHVPDGRQLIGGEWVAAVSGDTIDIVDPSAGAAIGAVPAGDRADVDLAVTSAEGAFEAWRDVDPRVRARQLRAWADLLEERAADLAMLEAIEVGRPYQGPVDLASGVHFVAGLVDKLGGQTLPTTHPDVLAFSVREPLGVCASIVPWNSPGILMLKSVAPALAAGNSMVVKPAEDAPLACLAIAGAAVDAGLPPGILNVVTGLGAVAGAALSGHRGIRHMSFTGSGPTGTAVMQACAENIVPVQLELGGKTPHIVFADADLPRAVPTIVRQVTRNAGQICYAGTRLLVHRSIADQVVEALADEMRRVRVGAWFEDVDMGPLINAAQQAKVLQYVDAGVHEGARLVVGGSRPEGSQYEHGYFVEPTLFADVDASMCIAQEEIFGPVLAVLTFDSEAEAIELANGTRFGLAAALWTSDIGRATRCAKRLEAGQVYVNTFGSTMAIGAPFGGYKQSGFGRTSGADSVLDYTQLKSVIIDGRA